MSISGAKTAIILAIAIVVGIAAISVGLGTLDMAQDTTISDAPPLVESQSDEQTPQPAKIDKSGFKIAPELVGIADYINTSPEELQDAMEDKVVLYDIWTYSCVNCIRTLPYITAWDAKYSDQGLLIIGIHSPEFEFEKELENVERAVEKYGIEYPVVMDNDMETWSAFENRYWPRKYIADHEGYIRYDHIGEGGYEDSELVIQKLLKERSAALGIQTAHADDTVDIPAFVHTGSYNIYLLGITMAKIHFRFQIKASFHLCRCTIHRSCGIYPETALASYMIRQFQSLNPSGFAI